VLSSAAIHQYFLTGIITQIKFLPFTYRGVRPHRDLAVGMRGKNAKTNTNQCFVKWLPNARLCVRLTQFHWNSPCNFGLETCRYTQNSTPFMSLQRNFHSLVPKCDYRNVTEMAEIITEYYQWLKHRCFLFKLTKWYHNLFLKFSHWPKLKPEWVRSNLLQTWTLFLNAGCL
jgi:hypothetical protein